MERTTRFSLGYYLAVFAGIFALQALFFSGFQTREVAYSQFRAWLAEGRVEDAVLTPDRIIGELKAPHEKGVPDDGHVDPPSKKTPWNLAELWGWLTRQGDELEQARELARREEERHFTVTRVDDPELVDRLQAAGVEYRGKIESKWLSNLLLNWILPFGALFVLWGFVMRRMQGGPNALTMGRSKAKVFEADPENPVGFADVAGVEEAVQEVQEVVDFLTEPARYTRLGAKLPKGVLLVGPPGTGKTLLARAIAGEAHVPFFSLSGSDFIEMFVGVGASRVRDLFNAAKEQAPCIVFIDELDAIGKSRSQGGAPVGGYDERENTLNQLLVELDGFDGRSAVVLMGATNRPEVLDAALLRPGRFDRQVLVDRPHRDGRRAILEVHARKLALADDVDLAVVAAQTPGFVGADLANLCNEAALLAARKEHPAVRMGDFQDAIERVIGGLEKKGQFISDRERRTVAYHESGHALVGHFIAGADPVQKVSIVPRGKAALGYTLQSPLEDRYLLSREELLGRVRVLLGGRAAEQVAFGEISTGASDDLEKASDIVRQMLTAYGMSERLPNVSLVRPSAGGFLGQGPQLAPHSATFEEALGAEQVELLGAQYRLAVELLEKHRDQLETLAQRLLKEEKLEAPDLLEILGPRPEVGGVPAAIS